MVLRSVDCLSLPSGDLRLALLLQNNTVETYSLRPSDAVPAATKTSRLTLGGHRTDARTLAFSSENTAILSASGETVKVWNRWVCPINHSLLREIFTFVCHRSMCSLVGPPLTDCIRPYFLFFNDENV